MEQLHAFLCAKLRALRFEEAYLDKLLRGFATLGEANTPSEARAESRGVRSGGRGVSPTRPQWYQPTLFEQESPQYDEKKTAVKGKIFVLDHDTNANGKIDFEDLEWEYLEGDGDFRSEEVCKLRDEADMICRGLWERMVVMISRRGAEARRV